MTDTTSIIALPYDGTVGSSTPPALTWVPIDRLRVETEYQRTLTPAGVANVKKIMKAFDWARLGALTVAPIGDDEDPEFAVIDGQHRATALASLGVEKAPCLVSRMDFEARAAAFVAINGAVTPVTAAQRYHAMVAAKDPVALTAEAACRRAGARVMRHPKASEMMATGETLAASSVLGGAKRHGEDVLALGLSLVTKTGDGHPGLLNAATIKAAVETVALDNRIFMTGPKLIEICADLDWHGMIEEAKRRTALAGKFGPALAAEVRAEVRDRLGIPIGRAAA